MEFETLKKDNRKKYVIGVIAILAIASVIFFVSTRANYKDEQRLNLINTTVNYSPSDLNVMAIKLQNSSVGYDNTNTIPTSGYTLSDKSYCEVNGSRDTSIPMESKGGKVSIGISKKGTKCYLFFDKLTAAKVLIAKNEMVHETFTNDNGEIVDTGYRYEGGNPNNYVTFNNELWRIIGVFNVETSSGAKETLIKLIKNESIGDIAWNTYLSNDWTQSDLKTILNGQYYNGEDINYTYRNPSASSSISSNPTVTITGKSIKDTCREMIENVKWNIGGVSKYTSLVSKIFTSERGTAVKGSNPTVWNGYIGLMYLSDYGYASDSTSCPRTANLSVSCKTNNWLYNGVNQWTLVHNSSDSTVYLIQNSGNKGYGYQTGIYSVRPVVYLKSSVSIVDNGKDGSSTNPYDLTM